MEYQNNVVDIRITLKFFTDTKRGQSMWSLSLTHVYFRYLDRWHLFTKVTIGKSAKSNSIWESYFTSVIIKVDFAFKKNAVANFIVSVFTLPFLMKPDSNFIRRTCIR